jgi:hypothetical protein
VRQKERDLLTNRYERTTAEERGARGRPEPSGRASCATCTTASGASLTAAMRSSRAGRPPPARWRPCCCESLDQLKLSVDAMNLPPGDVNALLLASLRYRFQPRIESAGLALRWDGRRAAALAAARRGRDAPPAVPACSKRSPTPCSTPAPPRCRSARARTTAASKVILADDGCGIDAASARRLRTMRERAAAIGATLSVEGLAPGTRCRACGCLLPRMPRIAGGTANAANAANATAPIGNDCGLPSSRPAHMFMRGGSAGARPNFLRIDHRID